MKKLCLIFLLLLLAIPAFSQMAPGPSFSWVRKCVSDSIAAHPATVDTTGDSTASGILKYITGRLTKYADDTTKSKIAHRFIIREGSPGATDWNIATDSIRLKVSGTLQISKSDSSGWRILTISPTSAWATAASPTITGKITADSLAIDSIRAQHLTLGNDLDSGYIPKVSYSAKSDSAGKALKDASGNTITSTYQTATNVHDTANAVRAEVGDSVVANMAEAYRDFSITGQILQLDRTSNIDLDKMWALNSDSFLLGMNFRMGSWNMGEDSNQAVHPSVVAVPFWFGVDSGVALMGTTVNSYQDSLTEEEDHVRVDIPAGATDKHTKRETKWLNWMAVTPYIHATGGDSTENPTIRVSHNDSTWVRPSAWVFDDTTGESTLVYCREPLVTPSQLGATHLSDPNLIFTHDKKLLCTFRVSAGSGQDRIMGITSDNGITWNITDTFTIKMGAVLSPSVVLNRDNTYRLYFLGSIANLDSQLSYVQNSTGQRYDTLWTGAETICRLPRGECSNVNDSLVPIQHFEIKRYVNQYICAFHSNLINNQGVWFASSRDGNTFTTRQTAVLQPAFVQEAGKVPWDSLSLYKATFTFRETGEGLEMPIWYSCTTPAGANAAWRMGFTIAHFGKPQTIEFTQVVGHNQAPGDNVLLTLPVIEGATGDDTTLYDALFKDSSYTSAAQDTARIRAFVPYNFYAESLIVIYKTNGICDSLILFGPDKSVGLQMADSVYWMSGTNLAATTVTRTAINIQEFLSAGDAVKLKFHLDMDATNDRFYLYRAFLKGREQ